MTIKLLPFYLDAIRIECFGSYNRSGANYSTLYMFIRHLTWERRIDDPRRIRETRLASVVVFHRGGKRRRGGAPALRSERRAETRGTGYLESRIADN